MSEIYRTLELTYHTALVDIIFEAEADTMEWIETELSGYKKAFKIKRNVKLLSKKLKVICFHSGN